jgi:aminodeoxyfutalosine deaminase
MTTQATVESFLTAVPKVELHLHLVGSASPATVAELARRAPGTDVPTGEDELAELFRFRDFPHFIEVYKRVNDLVTTAEDVAIVIEGAARDLAAQRVSYAEMTVTPYMQGLAGLPYAELLVGLAEGRSRAAAIGVEMAWIFDIPGQYGDEATRDTLACALDDPPDGLVALGLAGAEAGIDRASFAPAFAAARSAGLPGVPHAGEGDGPASVWAAIRHLEPVRIGHGVRAVEDPELVAHLAETGLPLEVCPTSNVCTRVAPSIAEHQVGTLLDAGVVVTINTDDPPMFSTTLTEEYRRVAGAFRLGVEDLAGLVGNAVEASFLPDGRKAELLDEVAAVRDRHAGPLLG